MRFNIWLERQLSQQIPQDVIAFNFNLYESLVENRFDVQLVGCKQYDLDSDDWACRADYSSGEDIYSFSADGWEKALETLIILVKDYLQLCSISNQFSAAEYISAGFVDGDLVVIAQK